MGPDIDCPVCGVEQIRPTCKQCSACEIAERYETRISALEDIAEERRNRAKRAEAKLDAIRDAARALLAAISTCNECESPATRWCDSGEEDDEGDRIFEHYCDVHGDGYPEFRHAPALRALAALVWGG